MNNQKKKMIAPIATTVFLVLYYVAYFGLIISFIPNLAIKAIFSIVPIVFAIGLIVVCKERIDEIKGGEEDDLSQY